ncbi:hypothetical protein HZ326_25893 [Fusarium oxysporum f. sp. albedinis]|nr:hypothetical protein HZ326_25893 [Fusarium oxysporum f. sp. albedinis]
MVIKDCSGQSREVTLKKDESFFPTTEWRHCPWVPRGWEKVSSDKKRLGHYVERSVKRARRETSQDVDGRPYGHNDTHVNNYEQALDNQLSDSFTDSDRSDILCIEEVEAYDIASMKSVTLLTWVDCPQLPCGGVMSPADIDPSGRKSPASGLQVHGASQSKAGCRSAATLLLLFSIGT